MWFDAQAALARIGDTHAPPDRSAPPDKGAGPIAGLAGIAEAEVRAPEMSPSAARHQTPQPYGESVGGRPLTYTGRVVSLEAWRSLTGWERYGPRGRIWDGLSRQWIETGKAEQ